MKGQKTDDLYGLVLAGGRSSRMGADKALLDFHGAAQKDYLFKLLVPYCNRVYTSIGNKAVASDFVNPIKDAYALDSPLNGILSAFLERSDVAWLSVPVDMPFVDENVIAYLIKNRDATKMATCFYDSDEKYPEPLLTIWESGAGRSLLQYHREGGTGPRAFLASQDIRLLKIPNKNALINVNTKEEFENAERYFRNSDPK